MIAISSLEDQAWPREEDEPLLVDALQRLLKRGGIPGWKHSGEAYRTYRWAYDNLEQLNALLTVCFRLKAIADTSAQFIQALPQEGCPYLKKFTEFETLLAISLWKIFDEHQRETDKLVVDITADELRQRLNVFFNDPKITTSSIREQLKSLKRFYLVEMEERDPFGESIIRINPAIARVINFANVEEWQRHLEQLSSKNDSGQEEESISIDDMEDDELP